MSYVDDNGSILHLFDGNSKHLDTGASIAKLIITSKEAEYAGIGDFLSLWNEGGSNLTARFEKGVYAWNGAGQQVFDIRDAAVKTLTFPAATGRDEKQKKKRDELLARLRMTIEEKEEEEEEVEEF